ncbi:hypothetical protein DXA95_16830, partial [Odoribacter sp. OF09-27XD]
CKFPIDDFKFKKLITNRFVKQLKIYNLKFTILTGIFNCLKQKPDLLKMKVFEIFSYKYFHS